jgi:hypothetical protein
MTDAQHGDSPSEDSFVGSRGLSRRTLIKGAAAAGAVAWAAPVIIDSVASPAAAATTCFSEQIVNGGGCQASGGAPCCTDGTENCSTSVITFTNNGTNLVITLHGSCQFSAGGVVAFYGNAGSPPCQTISPSGQTVTVPDAQNGTGHTLSHACVTFCCGS